MYTNKKIAKSVEQIKQEYEQAVDPGLVEFIQKVHSTDKAEANKLEYKVSGISKRQKNDIEKITGEPLSAIFNFIKGGTIRHGVQEQEKPAKIVDRRGYPMPLRIIHNPPQSTSETPPHPYHPLLYNIIHSMQKINT